MTEEKIYIMMNKPAGYVCSAVSDSHHTVYELLPPDLQELVTKPTRGHRLHTVGRLDCDTSGLLLLTNDGFFSHSLTAQWMSHRASPFRLSVVPPMLPLARRLL